MLLEIDNSELLHMLEDPASLQGKVSAGVVFFVCVLLLIVNKCFKSLKLLVLDL